MDRSWTGRFVRGGAAALSDAVYIWWEEFALIEGATSETFDQTERVLVTTALSPTGELLSEHRRRPFPTGVLSDESAVYALGATPNGEFAAANEWTAMHLGLGSVEDEEWSQSPLDDIDPGTMGYPAHVAWDGEAYLIELGNLDGQWAMRRSATGEPLLAPVRYGSLSSRSYTGYDLGYKTSTNPASGVTYAFAASSTRWLTGHTRDGQRLPWIPETGSLQLPPVEGDGVLPMSGASAPGVAADPEGGAWIVWAQSTTRLRGVGGVQHVDADGTLGPVLWFEPPAEDPEEPRKFALHAKTGAEAVLASATGDAIQVYDVTVEQISAPRPLVEIGELDGVVADFREMHLVSDGEEALWLVMQTNVYTRVLKVAPGCVYPMEPSPAE